MINKCDIEFGSDKCIECDNEAICMLQNFRGERSKYTTVRINSECRDLLKMLRISNDETYNVTILRLIKFYVENSKQIF